MHGLLYGLAMLVAVVAAVRSTWSPCGHSMLSTLTPMAERGRGHRWWVTAGWFILGGVLGGISLGLLAAGPAALLSTVDPAPVTLAAIAVTATAFALVIDLPLGLPLPGNRRQVDENWIRAFRPWVYGVGYGWQIGVGVATYTMTAALYLLVVLAALTLNPIAALLIGTVFGTVRGLAVLAGARLTDPVALRAFHARFEHAESASRWLVVATEAAVLVAVTATGHSAGVLLAVVPAVVAVAFARGSMRTAPAAPVDLASQRLSEVR